MGASQGLSPRAPRRRIAWLGVLPALSPLEAKEMSPDRKTRQNILRDALVTKHALQRVEGVLISR